VDEVDELDFQVLTEHLRCGDSVFITSRKRQKLKTWKTDADANTRGN
jgi:hypothetical protein